MNFLNTPPGQLLSAPASQSGTAGRIPGRASGPRRQRLPDHDGDRPVVVIRLGVRDERVRDVAANQLTARGGGGSEVLQSNMAETTSRWPGPSCGPDDDPRCERGGR